MTMKNEQIKEIIDGVYFEKLSLMLGNLQSWQKRKDQVFNDLYCSSISSKIFKMQKNQKEIKNQIEQLIKVLALQYQFLSKLKRQEKVVQMSSIYTCFERFTSEFSKIKSSLLQLSEFLGKCIGVTNYEYLQMKKIYDEASDIKNRYEYQKNKFFHGYNQKKQQMYSKKNMRKHFELRNYLDLLLQLQKQKKCHEQAFMRLHSVFLREMQSKVKMYKDITDNLQFMSKLYESGFKKEILSDMTNYFKKRLEDSSTEYKQFIQSQEKEISHSLSLNELKELFYQYFDQFVEQITVGNWSVSFNMKDGVSKQMNDKQTIHMFLTFDKKIFFYEIARRQILYEQTIEDVKIKQPTEDGVFEIKDKKQKQKYLVRFDRIQKQDQFFLHVKQMIKVK